MDHVTPEVRSKVMAAVGQKNTGPERIVRRLLHRQGYRFRLHRRDLPGKPDIVLPKHRKIILVHGCFWHRHAGCRYATLPKSRTEFWQAKFQRNVERDAKVVRDLGELGYRVLVVWQCETKDMETLEQKVMEFMVE